MLFESPLSAIPISLTLDVNSQSSWPEGRWLEIVVDVFKIKGRIRMYQSMSDQENRNYCKSWWQSGFGYKWIGYSGFGQSGNWLHRRSHVKWPSFQRVEVEMVFQLGQRSTRSFSMILRHLQALLLLFGKTVFSLFLSLSHWVAACYCYISHALETNMWVWGASHMSRRNWLRLVFLACCSHCSGGFHSASWRDKCLSLGPPISGTARFWACQCVIKRKTGRPREPTLLTNSKEEDNFLKLFAQLLCLVLFLRGRCQAKKDRRSLSKVIHLLAFYLVQPQFVTVYFSTASVWQGNTA